SPGSQPLSVLLCPSEAWSQKTVNFTSGTNYTFGLTNYGCIQGTQVDYYGSLTKKFDGVFYPNSVTAVGDVSDGLSNTIFFAEKTYTNPQNATAQTAIQKVGWWASCNYNSLEDYGLSSVSPINFTGCAVGGSSCDDRIPVMGSLHNG